MKKLEKFIAPPPGRETLIEEPAQSCEIPGMTALTSEALRLPPDERLKLIEDLWSSLSAHPESLSTSTAELRELDQRRERYNANPSSLIDWEDLKHELAKRRRDAH
jgi:putative addiction module component (TIGR02574 family)